MKRLLVLPAILCLSVLPFMGQNEPKLEIRVTSEKNSYSLHDTIRLTFVRENSGVKDLLVPREWGWGVRRTDVRVFDSKGREVRTDFLADELPPPPRPNDFILLEPGSFIGIHMNGKATEFVNSPGDYEFVVEYTSYLSESYAREVMNMPNVPFWSRERGTLTSNKIKLHITK